LSPSASISRFRGEVEGDGGIVRRGGAGLREHRAGVPDPLLVDSLQPSGRDLRRALHRTRDDLRHPAPRRLPAAPRGPVRLPRRRLARGAANGLEILLRGADGPLGGLALGTPRLEEAREASAERPKASAAKLRDPVGAREERAVVRRDEDGAAEAPDEVVDGPPRLLVEVVRRLVEEERLRLAEEEAREAQARRLAAGERRGVPPEVEAFEADLGQDPVDPPRGGVPRVEEVAGGAAAIGRGRLRKERDGPVAKDAAPGGPQRAGEKRQERALAGAVRPDEAGDAPRKRQVDRFEERRPVGQDERNAFGDEGIQHEDLAGEPGAAGRSTGGCVRGGGSSASHRAREAGGGIVQRGARRGNKRARRGVLAAAVGRSSARTPVSGRRGERRRQPLRKGAQVSEPVSSLLVGGHGKRRVSADHAWARVKDGIADRIVPAASIRGRSDVGRSRTPPGSAGSSRGAERA
jgi:hypothetical protein